MAKKNSNPSELVPAELTPAQLRNAIPKLQRRLEEIQQFDPREMTSVVDPTAQSLVKKLDSTLIDIFGINTLEYRRFRSGSLYSGSTFIGGTPLYEIVTGYTQGKELIISNISTAIDLIKEKLDEIDCSIGDSSPKSLNGINLHDNLIQAVSPLYNDQHYSSAIEVACKILNNYVQIKSGVFDKDNTDLMLHVFNKTNPILSFNDNSDESDKSEQQGMMHLFQGMFLAFRNPRAHKIIEDGAKQAFGVIHFISFLMDSIDKARKTSTCSKG